MRTENEILELVKNIVSADDNIRTVIINGSRSNRNIKPDSYQDFDLVFFVKSMDEWRKKSNVIKKLGDVIIMQMPNSMQIDINDLEHEKDEITYLMGFVA